MSRHPCARIPALLLNARRRRCASGVQRNTSVGGQAAAGRGRVPSGINGPEVSVNCFSPIAVARREHPGGSQRLCFPCLLSSSNTHYQRHGPSHSGDPPPLSRRRHLPQRPLLPATGHSCRHRDLRRTAHQPDLPVTACALNTNQRAAGGCSHSTERNLHYAAHQLLWLDLQGSEVCYPGGSDARSVLRCFPPNQRSERLSGRPTNGGPELADAPGMRDHTQETHGWMLHGQGGHH